MTRYRLLIEYDGGPFVGWQRQANGPSVQAAVERSVAAFCQNAATVHCAGRTDAGVHALGQVAHVDLPGTPAGDTVRDALNFHLKPDPVAILGAWPVGDDFHARFSAIGRAYRYRIVNRRAPPTLDRGRAWWVAKPLDAGAMATAATVLVGRHDFTSFRAKDCQADSPIRTLDRLDVTRQGAEIWIEARARGFLHHQIRNFAGTLRLVGEGKWTARDVRSALEARDRAAAGPTAPPEGLYFLRVDYQDGAGPDGQSAK